MNAIMFPIFGTPDCPFTAGIPAIFEDAPMGLCLLDGDLRCIGLNRRLAVMTGCSAAMSPGQLLADLLPTLFAAVQPELPGARVGAPSQEREISGDTLGWADAGASFLLSVQGLADIDGAVEQILVGLTDVTTVRRKLASTLVATMRRAAYAPEFGPHLPWIADPDGEIIEFSSRWLALTGMSREEACETHWSNAVHPDDLASTLSPWLRSLSSGEPFDAEYRVRLSDGAYRWIRACAAAERGEAGDITRWHGTIEDIHDRKLAEIAHKESEAFARSILASSPDCMKVLDLEGRMLFMSAPGLCAMEIRDFEPLRGTLFESLWADDDVASLRAAMAEARAGRISRFTAFRPTMSGVPKWWDVSVSPIHDPDGLVVRLLSISRDVTRAKSAQDEIEQMRTEAQRSAERLSGVLESTTDGVILVDSDWHVTYVNRNATALLEHRGLRVGASLAGIFPEQNGCRLDRECRAALTGQEPVTFEEYLASSQLWLEVHAYPAPGGISIFFRDITERQRVLHEQRQTQQRIAHMAAHDALTGLANRSQFIEQLEAALQRPGADGATAVLCLDLDGFKGVNDTFGHPVGDALLCQVAARLLGCLGGSDRVARFGGDEFAVLQLGLVAGGSAAQLAQHIVARLGQPYDLDGQQIAIGTSVGIALSRGACVGAPDLIKQADLALYAAKAAGRGTYRFFEQPMDEGLREKQALRTDLRLAVADGGFTLHYQPIFDLRSNAITCFEALLRWPHPSRGDVPPGEFIPVAEETGMIKQLGAWALREACREATNWPATMSVAVNLSSVQFRDRDLVTVVAAALAETGLAPERLELEITESVLLADSDANLAVLQALKQLGIRIAMDDFGTGYSSLGYLHRFAFDKIKIDRSFVANLQSSNAARAIVRAIVGLGECLGIAVTAEGVETHAQLDQLRAKGCDQAQGYLFSKPLGAIEAGRLMRLPQPCDQPCHPTQPGPVPPGAYQFPP